MGSYENLRIAANGRYEYEWAHTNLRILRMFRIYKFLRINVDTNDAFRL